MAVQNAPKDDTPSNMSPRVNRDHTDLERYNSAAKGIEAGHANYHGIDTRQVQPGADEAYDHKVAILNEALIDLGMGTYQWMVFLTTGPWVA